MANLNRYRYAYIISEDSKMGRVRTKTVKKASRFIIEKYYTKLTLDFDTNKRIIEEVALIPSKPLRNKVQILFVQIILLGLYQDTLFIGRITS